MLQTVCTPINLCDRISQKPGFVVSMMDGEKVMFSVAEGKYYNLGRQGGVIWDLIGSTESVASLVDSLSRDYDVERDVCEEQVLAFLNAMSREGLIEVESV